MPTQDHAVLSDSLYAEVAEAALQRAGTIHPQLAHTIQECAILRWFDVDVLAAFLAGDEAVSLSAEELLAHMQALHLVQPHTAASGRWLLLSELRLALVARPAVQEGWLTLHPRAAAAFRQRLDGYPASGEARFRDTGWRDLAVEWSYHLLHYDPIEGWHQVQLICAQAFAIPTAHARWEVDFCVQFLNGLAWPSGVGDLDTNIAELKAAFADLAAYRDSQALPVIERLASVSGLTVTEASGIQAWAGSVYLRDEGNLAAALTWLQQAAAGAPEDAEVQADLSEAYRTPGIWAGRFDLAEQHARRALAAAPASDAGCLAMGYLMQNLEDWAAAADWFRRAVGANPDVIDGYLGLSEVAAARRDVDAALGYIDAASGVNPGIRYYALIRRGHAYRDAGYHTEAAREYELARREAPDRTDAYVALGDLCSTRGRDGEAEDWYQQALHEDPADADALVALATLYHPDDPARAITMLEQALSSGVQTKAICYTLSDFYRSSGQIAEVARIQHTLLQLDGEEAYGGDCTMGRALLDAAWRQPAGAERAALLDQATGAFASAQARDARRAWAYLGLAEVAVLRDAAGDVEGNLGKVQDMAPWAAYDALVLIGQAYKDHYEGPAADACFQRAIEARPDRAAAWQALADLRAWQGDTAAVAQAWEQIVRIDPARKYAASVGLGDAFQAVGDDRRARDAYTAATALQPERAEAVLDLAELDNVTGRAREAAEQYQRAAALAPNLTTVANSRIARLLLDDDDDAGAEQAARSAVAANPRRVDGYVELARIGVARQRDGLVQEAQRALLAATGDRLVYDFDDALGEIYRDAGRWDAAHTQFAACIARDATRVDAYVGSGLTWLDQGNDAAAQRELEKALALDETRVDVHAALSRLHHAQGNVTGVRAAQARIVALQPTMQYDAHLAIGRTYEVTQQHDQAQAEYKAAIAGAPWRPDGYASLAVLLRRAHQPQAAEQAYRQARELAEIAYADLAWYYQQKGQMADAEWVYRLAIAEEPDGFDAYIGLVTLLATHDQAAEANDVLDSMAHRPELVYEAHLLRARLLVWQGRLDDAVTHYRDTIDQYPRRVEAYQELVRLYLDERVVQEALRILRQGHVALPAEPWFVWLLAQVSEDMGQHEDARRWYLQAGKLDPVDTDASVAYQRAADIALRQNRQRAAQHAVQQAIQRNPNNAGAYFLLGELRERQQKLADAAAAYTRATTIAPKFGEAYRARGRVYGRLGDLGSLDAMARDVLALNPNEAYDATIVVADAFRQASEYRRAEAMYRQAIDLRPGQAEAMLRLASLLERQQRLVESVALYQQAATHLDDPQAAADAWGQAGRLLAQMAQYAAAETAFRTACTVDPENAGLHEALGDLYERTGDLAQAAASYDRARTLNPNNADLYVALARVAGQQANSHKLAWVVRHVRELNLSPAYEYDRLLLIANVYRTGGDTKRAVTAYRQAIAVYPQRPDAYWDLMRLWIEQERLADALAVAKSMMGQTGLLAEAWMATANLLAQRDDLVAAENAWQRALAADPDNGDTYLELARFYETNDRPADATAVLRQGCSAVPNQIDLAVALAERLSAQGQRNDAIGLLQQATVGQAEPADVSNLHWRIGDLWLQEEHPDRAQQAWRRALAQNPDNANAYYSLGQWCERNGQLDEALAFYTRATEVAPKYRDAYAARGHILAKRGDLSGIAEMAQELAALFLEPDETYQAHVLLASIYVDAGFYDAASRELNTAIALDADAPDAHIQLGWVYEVQRQWSKAGAEYERVAQLVPDLQPSVALRLGQLHVNEGNPQAAIQSFQRSIELAPDGTDGYFSLARLYESQGQLADARATYAQMLRRGPEMAALAHQALGTLAERQGDAISAEAEYQQALALTPQDASAHLLLAQFYESTAQWDKAIAGYQRVAELDPSQASNALLFTADIQRQLGRTQELRVTCDRVVALVDAMPSPDYHALRQRGLAFAMQGEFAHAEAGLRQALAANSADFQTHFYLAVTLTYLGRSEEAEHHLTEGIRLAQSRSDLFYALREAEVMAAHEPPIPGAAALRERLRTVRDALP